MGPDINNAQHDSKTHVENSTEQPLVRIASGEGLDSSHLLRLPLELRIKIFEMALIHPTGISLRAGRYWNGFHDDKPRHGHLPTDRTPPPRRRIKTMCFKTLWALRLMATCQQIRSEVKNGLLSSNDINVHGVDFNCVDLQQPGILHVAAQQPGILHTVPLIQNISSVLGMRPGRVVLWENRDGHTFAQYERQRREGLPPARRIQRLDHSLARYAQAIQPFQLFFGLSMHYQELTGNKDIHLCKQDAPVTLTDCWRIQCVVPLGDPVKARKMVDEAIYGRLALLRRHFEHRLCNVRAMRQKLESGLAAARQYMREEVDRIC